MTNGEIAAAGLIALTGMVLFRIPVAVAMGLVGFFGYASVAGFSSAAYVLASSPIELASGYSLSVIPLFGLMGALASFSGLSQDLFYATERAFKGVRGAMALAAVGACAAFGAVCGSSVATAATMTRVALPVMIRSGYSRPLAAGAIAAGGTLGVLIPPSTILLIYGLIAEQSISRLFLAAIVPGLLLTVLYMIVVYLYARLSSGAVPDQPAEGGSAGDGRNGGKVWHVGLLFAFVIGGIYLGWFSPTEAAALGAFGALLLGLVMRRIDFRAITGAFIETTSLTARLFLIILASTIFSYFVIQTRISGTILDAVNTLSLSPTTLILCVVLFYILAGCVLEGIGMILITVPIVYPVLMAAGFDPVWFGVLLVVLVEIGLITPPVGMNLFVIRTQSKEVSMSEIFRGVLPFLVAPLVLIALLIAFPDLALWLPSTVFK